MSVEEKQIKAGESADRWLNSIDRAEYSESWFEAATYLQNNVALAEWQRTLHGVRQPLGKVLSREVASMQYLTTLPGSPDGEYVVIQYNTTFANKESAVETVTPMLDSDGKWKVLKDTASHIAGYYIK